MKSSGEGMNRYKRTGLNVKVKEPAVDQSRRRSLPAGGKAEDFHKSPTTSLWWEKEHGHILILRFFCKGEMRQKHMLEVLGDYQCYTMIMEKEMGTLLGKCSAESLPENCVHLFKIRPVR